MDGMMPDGPMSMILKLNPHVLKAYAKHKQILINFLQT